MFSRALTGFATPEQPTQQPEGFTMERRHSPRVELPFPVLVRGTDATGDHFEIETALDALSARGLSLRLPRPVQPNTKLFLIVRLGFGSESALRIAIRGLVVRTDALPDGCYGVVISFRHHRLLYAA